MKPSIHILGAGIIGICCALELQRRGFRVTLIDRLAPARETSYGNAGVLATGSITPEAAPDLWRHLPGHLLNRGADVHLHYRQLPRMLPYLGRFLLNTRGTRFRRHATALDTLLNRAVDGHLKLIDQCAARDLLVRRGWLKLYRSERALAASADHERLLTEHGVEFTRLGPSDLLDLEPHLRPVFAGARWITGAASIVDPGELGRRYAEAFAAAGGALETRHVNSLRRDTKGWRIGCEDAELHAERVVVALGAWSRALLAALGYRMPLIAERGYHQHFLPHQGAGLNRPIHDLEGGYVLAPMAMGHRLTTGVEWAALDAPPTPIQLRRVIPRVREAFPLGIETGDTWLGNRPQTPDSLPAIGPVPGHDDLWLATGHGHLGLSLGAVTGDLLARQITGEPGDIDMTPYSPARFA